MKRNAVKLRDITSRTAIVAVSAARLAARGIRLKVNPRRSDLDAFTEAVVTTAERLGGAYIKFGQLLSTRPDLVGPAMADRLARLQDDVAPMHRQEAWRIVSSALPEIAGRLREAVEQGPIASGSIASVYRWQPPTGAAIAFKVRRPSAVRTVPIDTATIRAVARLLNKLPPLRTSPLKAIADQLCTAIERQLDLPHEQRMLDVLADALDDSTTIRVPRPIHRYCSDEILAMEYIDGLTRDSFTQATDAQRQESVISLVQAVYRLVFEFGFIHVDLHQGNAYMLPGGHIALLDVGFAHVLTDFARDRFTRFFGGMVTGDGNKCADILLSTTSSIGKENTSRFRAEVIALVEKSAVQDVVHFSLPKFAMQLFLIQQRNGYYADPEMTFPLLCLIGLEGTVKRFTPDMDFQIEAAPYIMASLLT
jgi:ubiquinone biosynthesis protein